MKVLYLSPSDMLTEPVIAGLESLHEVVVYRYDRHGVPVDHGMIAVAERERPDVTVYCGQNSGHFMASVSTFVRLRSICPTVLICHDGSDKTWTRVLQQYHDAEAFSVIVNIDGNPDWPQRANIDLTALTPVCEGFYV